MLRVGLCNQKGGVGKTTSAVALAALAAELWGRVLLVDADPNASAAEWAGRAGDVAGFAYTAETDPAYLARLRELGGWDVVLVDTAGARETGALEAVVRAVDAVVLPTLPAALDLRALVRTVRDVVCPAAVPHRVLMTRVDPRSWEEAEQARTDLVDSGLSVFSTMVRSYKAHPDAALAGVPITRWRGRYARDAEMDYRRVAAELFRDWPVDGEGATATVRCQRSDVRSRTSQGRRLTSGVLGSRREGDRDAQPAQGLPRAAR